jgi:hypothetical protein
LLFSWVLGVRGAEQPGLEEPHNGGFPGCLRLRLVSLRGQNCNISIDRLGPRRNYFLLELELADEQLHARLATDLLGDPLDPRPGIGNPRTAAAPPWYVLKQFRKVLEIRHDYTPFAKRQCSVLIRIEILLNR